MFYVFCPLTISQWNSFPSVHITLLCFPQNLNVITWCRWIIIHPGICFDGFSLWLLLLAIINTAVINIIHQHFLLISDFSFFFCPTREGPRFGIADEISHIIFPYGHTTLYFYNQHKKGLHSLHSYQQYLLSGIFS